MVRKLSSLSVLAVLSIISTQPLLSADNWEHWNDVNVSHKIDGNKSIAFSDRLKFRDIPSGNIYIASGKLGFGYSTRFHLIITPSYRIDWIDKANKEEYEHRYSLQLDYKRQIGDIKTTVTQITELRYFTLTSKDHLRLRIRVNISKSFRKPLNPPIAIYFAPEIFYDNINDEISRLRVYSGFDIKLMRDLSLRLGYILQNDKGKADIHIFNTGRLALILFKKAK